MFDLIKILYKDIYVPTIVARDLVDADSADPAARAQKIMEWSYSHSLEEAKLIVGTALSTLASLLFAYLKNDLTHAPQMGVISGIASVIALIIGSFLIVRLREIDKAYINALHLVNAAKNARSVMDAMPTLFA